MDGLITHVRLDELDDGESFRLFISSNYNSPAFENHRIDFSLPATKKEMAEALRVLANALDMP